MGGGIDVVVDTGLPWNALLDDHTDGNRSHAELLRTLEHRQRVLTEMVRVQRALARPAPLVDKLALVTAAVSRVLDIEMVAIRLLDPQTPDELVIAAGIGLSPDSPLRSPVEGSGVGGAAFRSNAFVRVDNYAEHPAAMPLYRSVRAAMAAPVQQFGRAVGSIVAAITEPGREFGDADRDTLLAFADQASIALTEKHLFDAMQQAYVDPLTGLANRIRFHDQLASSLELAPGSGAMPALLFIDLDGFKLVNDTLGHGVGDELLVKVAERLRLTVTSPAVVARFGGDEFTILLPDVTTIDTATDVAEQVLTALTPVFQLSHHDVSVSASIGIAWHSLPGQTAAATAVDLLRNADTAMYRAKARGRGRHAVFETRMHDDLVDRLARESSLRAAVAADELTNHYQPVLDMVSETPVGAEALVRWPRDGRLVPPAHFVPLAEETGLIVPLGRQVFERACLMLVTWRHAGLGVLSMSVNISVRELERPTLIDELEELLTRTGVTPTQLILELTESALMHDVTTMSDRLTQLRRLGVRIAIDDFGTGFSSLSRLRWLPIDILKIDKSFVDEVDADDQGRAMIRTVIQLADALGLDVVAEGVERPAQRDALIELGCRFGQGYLFARPMPAPALMELLDRGRTERTVRFLAAEGGRRVR